MTNFHIMKATFSKKQVPIQILQSPRFFYLLTNLNGDCLLANDLFNKTFNVDVNHSFDQSFSISISPAHNNKYNDAITSCSRG